MTFSGPDRMQAWLEKSDERFYRLGVQNDELEEQRSGTQQSLVKVEAALFSCLFMSLWISGDV